MHKYIGPELDYYHSILKDNLQDLLQVAKDGDVVLKSKKEEIEKSYELFNPAIPLEVQSDRMKNGYYDEGFLYSTHYKSLLHRSTFISLFAYFEFYLKFYCEIYQRFTNHTVGYKDIKGNSDIDSFRKYLNLIASVDTATTDNPDYQKISLFKKIRNNLVHHNGFVSNSNKELRKILSPYIGVSFAPFDEDTKYLRLEDFKLLSDCAKRMISFSDAMVDGIIKSNGK